MDERRLPFTEHLRELRIRLRNAVIALMVGCSVSFYFAADLFRLLARPLDVTWQKVFPHVMSPQLAYASLPEPFWVYFKLSMYAGVFLASPVIFHQLWRFVAPGLYDRERRIALPFAACSGLMFIGGGAFCYFLVFPAAFKFFLSYSSAAGALGIDSLGNGKLLIAPNLFMHQYLDLTTTMLLGFGLVFELPLLIFFMSYVGIITHRSLWKFNKYWVVISFIVGGILTPGPDVISQLFMALPLVVLYNASIFVSYLVTKKRERAAAEASSVGNQVSEPAQGDAAPGK
jgi:sec-independent protein translocase protein TatC